MFEPERFYDEVRSTWTDPTYSAFGYGGWCKVPGNVPVIARDGRSPSAANEVPTGRPMGIPTMSTPWSLAVRFAP